MKQRNDQSPWSDFIENLDEALSATRNRLAPDQFLNFQQDFFNGLVKFVDTTAAAVDARGGRSVWAEVRPFWIVLKRTAEEQWRNVMDVTAPPSQEENLKFLFWAAEDGDVSHVMLIESILRDAHERPQILHLAREALRRISERDDLREFVQVLTGALPGDVIESATRLHEIGISARDGCETRGSLDLAAGNRMPKEDLRKIAGSLYEPGVSSSIALALGQWGGAEVIESLQDALSHVNDLAIQLRLVRAVRNIGGPNATRLLCQVLEFEDGELREAALRGLDELATGGTAIYTETVSPNGVSSGKAACTAMGPEVLVVLRRVAAQRPDDSFKRRVEEVMQRLRDCLGPT